MSSINKVGVPQSKAYNGVLFGENHQSFENQLSGAPTSIAYTYTLQTTKLLN